MRAPYFSEARRNSNAPSQELLTLAMTLKNPKLMIKLDPLEAYQLFNAILGSNQAATFILAIGTSKTFEEAVNLTSQVSGYVPTEETKIEFENFVYLLLMRYAMQLAQIINETQEQYDHLNDIIPARFSNRP